MKSLSKMIISDYLDKVDLDVTRVLSGTCLLGRNALGVAASCRCMC